MFHEIDFIYRVLLAMYSCYSGHSSPTNDIHCVPHYLFKFIIGREAIFVTWPIEMYFIMPACNSYMCVYSKRWVIRMLLNLIVRMEYSCFSTALLRKLH